MKTKPGEKSPILRLTTLGLMVAMSIALVSTIHFPIFPQFNFLEYDPADIPIFICTYLFGPWWGLALTAVTCVVQGVTVSAQSGPYGIMMHFIATGTHVLVSGLIFRWLKGKLRLPAALVAGTVAWTLIMIPANLFITSIYMEAPQAVIIEMLPYILTFNLIKAGANSIITGLVFYPVQTFYKKLHYGD